MIGSSDAHNYLVKEIEVVAQSDLTVLITGAPAQPTSAADEPLTAPQDFRGAATEFERNTVLDAQPRHGQNWAAAVRVPPALSKTKVALRKCELRTAACVVHS